VPAPSFWWSSARLDTRALVRFAAQGGVAWLWLDEMLLRAEDGHFSAAFSMSSRSARLDRIAAVRGWWYHRLSLLCAPLLAIVWAVAGRRQRWWRGLLMALLPMSVCATVLWLCAWRLDYSYGVGYLILALVVAPAAACTGSAVGALFVETNRIRAVLMFALLSMPLAAALQFLVPWILRSPGEGGYFEAAAGLLLDAALVAGALGLAICTGTQFFGADGTLKE
jgi:hypothetical protein